MPDCFVRYLALFARFAALAVAIGAVLAGSVAHSAEPLKIGSKRFTESYIVGEILALTARQAGVPARHLQGLGNTAILYAALRQGSIDAYPEYLGTIAAELLKLPAHEVDLATVHRALADRGLGVAVPLGFSNSYGIAVLPAAGPANPPSTTGSPGEDRALLTRISDLAARPALRFGLSHEFIGRTDGWPGLRERYGLRQTPAALDHGLAYQAIAAGQVDVIDVYTTDAQIARLKLRVLTDDRRYFPRYDAVILYRLDLPQRHPQAWVALQALAGRIDEAAMREMNGRAEIDSVPFASIAAGFVAGAGAGAPGAGGGAAAASNAAAATPNAAAATPNAPAGTGRAGFLDRLLADDFARLAWEHLRLVLTSVLIAVLIGVPLGVIASSSPTLERIVLAVTGIAQTIPSLALLAMLIPLVGRIGTLPALIALVTYALLPIVRNTCVGLAGVAPGLRGAALAIGLTPRQRLTAIDLPLAAPVIIAGVKTAAVVSVGTATIAAFIGAGGFGERISVGLALNDHAMLLAGAVPAAGLAVLTQWFFDALERRWMRAPTGR